MARLKIANQLAGPLGEKLASAVPSADFVPIPYDTMPVLAADIRAMVALPFTAAGIDSPPPPAWPFGLEWIHLLTAGLDQYPEWLFNGPQVTSSPGAAATALAEFALAAIFAAAKQIPEVWISGADEWSYRVLNDVGGKMLGIVGFGAIGEALARRALALGMEVQALRQSNKPLLPSVARAESLAALFSTSDHVVLALPATDATSKLVDRETLSAAKPGLHLVNIARGEIVDTDALIEALDDGRLSRATLDVTDPEPLPSGHRLYSHPKIKVSPHTSGSAPSTERELIRIFSANVDRFAAGDSLLNIVSRPHKP